MKIDSKSFDAGVVWACSILVRLYDQPSMAIDIFQEAGISMNHLRQMAEYDLAPLRKHYPSQIPKGADA